MRNRRSDDRLRRRRQRRHRCRNDGSRQTSGVDTAPTSAVTTTPDFKGKVDIGGRSLFVFCTGTGSPTVVLEAGDSDSGDSYDRIQRTLAQRTRTCSYDRANLGSSDPAPGPRGLAELVGDLEAMLAVAEVPPPYVLVGASGGGYIATGFAVKHPDQVAGIVTIDTPRPAENPEAVLDPELVEFLQWDNPENIERRDYLQVEAAAWHGALRSAISP